MEIVKDVLIIGGGPAGMSAALYLLRSKYSFVIVEKAMVGGKLSITTEIENYPGVGKIDGLSLAMKMKDQLSEHGIKIEQDNILDINKEGNEFIAFGEKNTYKIKQIILATGTNNKKLGIKKEYLIVQFVMASFIEINQY